jgi:hypothetical protein
MLSVPELMSDISISGWTGTRGSSINCRRSGPEIASGAAFGDEDRAGLAESICRRVGSARTTTPVGTCAMGSARHPAPSSTRAGPSTG